MHQTAVSTSAEAVSEEQPVFTSAQQELSLGVTLPMVGVIVCSTNTCSYGTSEGLVPLWLANCCQIW